MKSLKNLYTKYLPEPLGLIYEGLIYSLSIKKMIDKIENLKYFKNSNSIIQRGNVIAIKINQLSKQNQNLLFNEYDLFLSLVNNLGWFVSSLYIEDTRIKYDDQLSYWINIFKDEPFEFWIYLEAKYDEEDIDSSHKYFYHVTDKKNIEKIKKIGLIPKSKQIGISYPPRIYLLKSIKNAKLLLKSGFNIKDPIIIVLDKNKINQKIFLDSEFKNYGFYVVNSISKEAIIKTISF